MNDLRAALEELAERGAPRPVTDVADVVERRLAAAPGRRAAALAAAVLVVVGVGVGVVALAGDDDGSNVVTEPPAATTTSTETTVTTVDVTTPSSVPDILTTTSVLPTTVPPTTSVTTPRPPRTTTTRADQWTPTPLEPGTVGWGYRDYGAARTVENGRTKVVWGIYERDQWSDTYLQSAAEIYDPGLVVNVVIEYGDGTTWSPPSGNYGRHCQQERPQPIFYQGDRHTYSATGDLPAKVTVTTRTCDGGSPTGDPGSENVTTATLTVHSHPGTRPKGGPTS